jgi:type I restriction enzyme S subunit
MTEVGLIPMDWEVKRLGEIGESIRGVSFRPEQTSHTLIPNSTMLLRANNIQNNQIACQDVVYVMNDCIADYQQLIEGDVLICSANGSRNLVGKAAIWSKESSATFGAFMAVFRCAKGVDSCFVGYLFQSKRYRMQLDDILTGSAINNLNAKDIDELKFAFPSLAEQKAIAEVLSDMDAEISELEAQKAKFESIKQGVMQELLTGKTRLV